MLAIVVHFKNVGAIIENGLSYLSLLRDIKPEQPTTEPWDLRWSGDVYFGTNADTLLDDAWACSLTTMFNPSCMSNTSATRQCVVRGVRCAIEISS